MELGEVMRALRAAGTAQNRTVYPRHGARDPMFGVSYGDLGKLAKRIKLDHDLALELWATGNHDARVLATRVADPSRLTAKQADAWLRDVDNYILSQALAGLVARARCGPGRASVWRRRRDEWIAATGWAVTAHLIGTGDRGEDEVDDASCRALLDEIQRTIHAKPNRVRHEMNMALIVIGGRPSLRAAAVAAARRVGTVEVDHGTTGCVTPAAIPYIEKMAAHQAKRATPARR